jgi:hypothetical protein
MESKKKAPTNKGEISNVFISTPRGLQSLNQNRQGTFKGAGL